MSMSRKQKSEMFKDAHAIARRTKKIVGDYMIAFKLALKTLWLQEKFTQFEHKLCERHIMFTDNSPINKMSKIGNFFRKNNISFRKTFNYLDNYFIGIASSWNDREYITFCLLFDEQKINKWLGIE